MTENTPYTSFPSNNNTPYSSTNNSSQWAYQSQGIPAYATPAPVYTIEPPLNQPWYGIDFGNAIKRFFQKYATFSGRASRGEYWWSYLGINLLSFGIGLIGLIPIVGTFISIVFTLAIIIPSIAVAVRRLHDTNRSGWWLLLPYGLTFAGVIILLATLVPTALELEASGENIDAMSDTETLKMLAPIFGGMLAYLLFILAGLIITILLMALPSKPEGVRFDKQAPAQATPMPVQAFTQGYTAYPGQPYTQQNSNQQAYGQTSYSQQGYSQPNYGQQQYGALPTEQLPTEQLSTENRPPEAQPPYSPMQ